MKKRGWEAIKTSYGQYWYNVRNRLHAREDCLLIDDRIVIPAQSRQTVLDSLHLTHPVSAAVLNLGQHVWFPQKHKTNDGKILRYTPHPVWVQTFGKQPRLFRNRGVAFVITLLLYGPHRPFRLCDYVAYKPARRFGIFLRFLDIEQLNVPQHLMFYEDTEQGLPRKLAKQEKAAGQQNKQSSPTKRREKSTAGRTDDRPTHKLQPIRGMSLQTEEKNCDELTKKNSPKITCSAGQTTNNLPLRP